MTDSMNAETRIGMARELLGALESGQLEQADLLIAQLAAEREEGLFRAVGKITRELHDALRNMQLDSRLAGLTENEIPDVRQRLKYVMEKTESSANRTLNALEDIMPHISRIDEEAKVLLDEWGRFTRRELALDEFKQLSGRVNAFLGKIQDANRQLSGSLNEIMMAQDFQDLTGQVIGRVIDLVQEVEENLVELVRVTGASSESQPKATSADISAEGPRIVMGDSPDVVQGQDDVDDLLASLGF